MILSAGIFVVLTVVFTVLMAASAQRPRADGSVYNLLDRLSWIAGGVITIAVGFWRPWFIETWWKAAIFAIILCISFSALFLLTVGSVLSSTAQDPVRTAIRIVVLIVLLLAVFFGLKSCGA